ncbi:MAG: T9SS type A sorting domain-containing protein, partial [bacterium]
YVMKKITIIFFIYFTFLLIGGQHSLLNAQQVTVSPQPLYFGITPEERDTYRYMVIRNTSSEALNISSIIFQGTNASDFSVVSHPGSLNLSAFGRTDIEINFHPISAGDKQAQIVFESNAASSPDIIDLIGGASSVSGSLTFEKILGTLEGDGASDVRPTTDGGFIICGSTDNIDEEANDAYLVKTNTYGEIEWTEVYDSDDNDENSDDFSSVIPVTDGYIAVGNTDNGSRDLDLWIVKTDLNGVFQWDLLFGGTDNDAASVIESTNDGNFIIAGYTFDTSGETGRNGYLIKINGEGTELWSQIIGGSDGENFSSVKQTADNGFILCGTISTGGIGSDMYLVKTNSSGEVSWEKQYGNAGEENVDVAGSVVIAPDGGFVVAGRTTSFGAGANDVYVIKTDANGVQNTTWGDKTFGEEHHDGASEVITTSDGGYLIVGSIENHYEPLPINDWYSDVYIIKLDQNGDFEWDNVYGGLRGEGASMVRELDDGSFIICGRTSSYGSSGDGDIYFLRLNIDGNIFIAIEDFPNIIPEKMHLDQNYPNPFNNETIIEYQLTKASHVILSVYNVNGQRVKTLIDTFKQGGIHSIHFNAIDLTSGLYLYEIKTADFIAVNKMLLMK